MFFLISINSHPVLAFPDLSDPVEDSLVLQKDISILGAEEVLTKQKNSPPLIVAVIDTGIYEQHPCFKNQLWTTRKKFQIKEVRDGS